MSGKVKVSSEQKQTVLTDAANALRSLAAERDFYRDKLATIASRQRVEKLAQAMVEKGLESGSISQIADRLEKQAKQGALDLDVTEKAVELVGPDMGKVAHVNSDENYSAVSSHELERFIMS